MEPGATVYADRGGYGMSRSIREVLEKRGYDVNVGKMRTSYDRHNDEDMMNALSSIVPANVKYVVSVQERREKFFPLWCPLNGFWWWNFNVSIADQQTGTEIMTWRGRGCANSSIQKLNNILDELEK